MTNVFKSNLTIKGDGTMLTKGQFLDHVLTFKKEMAADNEDAATKAMGEMLFALIDAQQRQADALEVISDILRSKAGN